MASESLALFSNIPLSPLSNNMPLFAGGVAAIGVATLIYRLARRTKNKFTKRAETDGADHKRKTWRKELGDDLKNLWATATVKGRERERNETFVNPIDVWIPSDLERGLERIPGPPSIMEMDDMDGISDTVVPSTESPNDIDENMRFVEEDQVVKIEPKENIEEMTISPVPSSLSSGGPLVCDYPGCKTHETFPSRSALKHHARYHTKNHFCHACDKSFAVPKDLKRHILSRHTSKDGKKMWFCTVHGCKNAKTSMPRAGIDRKDNWQRHMRVSHRKSSREIAALEAEALGDT